MNALKGLFFILIPSLLEAQPWPSTAAGPQSHAPFEWEDNSLIVYVHGSSVENDNWRDRKTAFGMMLGLNHGLALQASTGARELSGFGAYQKGIEDSRLSLSWQRPQARRLSVLCFGTVGIPTGYRKQQTFFDSATDTVGPMPSFSLGQTFGELAGGLRWSPSSSANLQATGGYFASSDRSEQAFRWAMLAVLTPFGSRLAAEVGYAQSVTRVGRLPDTQTVTASLPIRLIRQLTLAPGVWADLGKDPLFGFAIGLRLETRVRATGLRTVPVAALGAEARRSGRVLVPPPINDTPIADRTELWNSLQTALSREFAQVTPLNSLDVPGLPYNDQSDESLLSTARAIAAEYDDARWLVVSRVEREVVSKTKDGQIPLVVSRPAWKAECRLRVRWVDLLTMTAYPEQTIDAEATYHSGPQLLMMSSSQNDVLSSSASRTLTFEAYRIAGREMAREIPRAVP